MEVNLNLLKKQKGDALNLCSQYEKKMKALEKELGALRQSVSEDFEDMHKFLIKEEETTMTRIQQEEDQTMAYMETRVLDLEDLVSSLTDTISSLELSKEMEKLQGDAGSESRERSTTVYQATLHQYSEQLKNLSLEVVTSLPLQYSVWKRLRNIVKPSQESLTLDPDTAHPFLALSADLKAVKLASKAQRVSWNPQRFNFCLNVLGSHGFRSGTHYWEIHVGKKSNWIIGIAAEHVQHKEVEKLSPKNGYWTLRKVKINTYYALTSPAAGFTLDTNPRTVGIYLDYESNQVSFYNADSMILLFTFSDPFKEQKLFPFLCPGLVLDQTDYEPLRFCH
ncbi:nuclear factor 7, brain [Microcaecilia unicolor]|uniref:Nuclear factor 7, brain-like n=1 Tax=Microcaecilia unicolor TaxID=1415580 RepID=A0A6P7ZWX8_9AMPH|nr:nuclear factor 7, brain-like [Microcaecilia unicolor]XP_030077845.1 nuclear factor 7, brain-like [Microcaecilia unicolor]XP_030077846.1 nuclear factor 7, brain-like [Microcaecilia unicolor]